MFTKKAQAMSDRVEHLVGLLNNACRLYYNGTSESDMSDKEYDRYLTELEILEHESGIRLPDSPTGKVGYKEDGAKVKHYSPMLSLKSSKDVADLQYFLGPRVGALSWKLDGCSIILYYMNGKLIRALSRGDGQLGKDITENVKQIQGVPHRIKHKDLLIIRGEGCCSLKEFEQIKRTTQGERYSNPRNLASGLINSTKTVSLLLKHLIFIAHSAVLLESPEWSKQKFKNRTDQLLYLATLGFITVLLII